MKKRDCGIIAMALALLSGGTLLYERMAIREKERAAHLEEFESAFKSHYDTIHEELEYYRNLQAMLAWEFAPPSRINNHESAAALPSNLANHIDKLTLACSRVPNLKAFALFSKDKRFVQGWNVLASKKEGERLQNRTYFPLSFYDTVNWIGLSYSEEEGCLIGTLVLPLFSRDYSQLLGYLYAEYKLLQTSLALSQIKQMPAITLYFSNLSEKAPPAPYCQLPLPHTKGWILSLTPQ